jgi:RNA polymerase sigma-70 factor (ECF subfamily)
MARIKEGDLEAYELLLDRHQRPVFNTAYKFLHDEADAEDITQEVFIRVYKAAATYSPQAKFTTWLYTIVKNLCFNAIRKKRTGRLLSIEDETVPEMADHGDDPSAILSREQVRRRVIRAVHNLPHNLRLAIILQKFHGFSYDEIAGMLGCSQNAVKLRVHRAKQYLARELETLKKETY